MLQVSISKKKQRNFDKNKRKLKVNTPTRGRVSPGTARTKHEGEKIDEGGNVKRAIVCVRKKRLNLKLIEKKLIDNNLFTISFSTTSTFNKIRVFNKISSLGCL